MIVIFYYRTTDPDILEAYRQDEMAVARIETVANKFAEQFGARAYFTMGFDSHFAGIGFDKKHPCRNPALWTKATDKDPRQVPRSPERAGAELRKIAQHVYDLYHNTFPTDAAKPRISELGRALDVLQDKPELLIYHEVRAERAAYIACSTSLGLDEITASQYIAGSRLAQSPFQPISVAHAAKEAANG